MSENRNTASPKTDETRQQSSPGAAPRNAGGARDTAERQPNNLPAAGGTANNPAAVPALGNQPANTGGNAVNPGLAVVLGQIAALNWEISGNVRVTPEQEAILRQPVDPDWVEIKYPDIPFLPVAYYRKTLNDAFGPMGWALVEVGGFTEIKDCYYLPCVLLAEGKPVAKAIGQCEVKGGNQKLTHGDLIEACRSNAITRCCKSLGIAEEMHWPAWKRKFVREHCRELGKDKWGNIPLARKDDEAGAKLFLRKMEDSEIYGRPPSAVAQFATHAERIMSEPDLTPALGRVPRPGEPGRDEWERAQEAKERAVTQDIEAEHDSWEEEGE